MNLADDGLATRVRARQPCADCVTICFKTRGVLPCSRSPRLQHSNPFLTGVGFRETFRTASHPTFARATLIDVSLNHSRYRLVYSRIGGKSARRADIPLVIVYEIVGTHVTESYLAERLPA